MRFENIKRIREEKGISQEMLASLTKLNKVSISYYETGRRKPGPTSINLISVALGYSDTNQFFAKLEEYQTLADPKITCENCRYWVPVADGKGECRCNPPVTLDRKTRLGLWPLLHGSQFCGKGEEQ